MSWFVVIIASFFFAAERHSQEGGDLFGEGVSIFIQLEKNLEFFCDGQSQNIMYIHELHSGQ